MKVLEGIERLGHSLAKTVVTLGNFDGVHLGHQALLRRTVAAANSAGVPSVVFTFDPHPAAILRPDSAPKPLLTRSQQIEFIDEMGVSWLVIEPFHQQLAAMGAREFLEQKILRHLHPLRLVVGHDFALGKNRQGGIAELREWQDELTYFLDVVEPVTLENTRISSSTIRVALSKGQVDQVAKWMGRPFAIRGPVERGDGRGLKLGFPTANVKCEGQYLPKSAVYLTKVKVAQIPEREFLSVTNVGRAPTFGDRRESPRVECHILDQNLNLYGSEVTIKFIDFVRDEMKFESVESLVGQIKRDVEYARRRERD